jgi:ADP-ribosylglycohydrolase
VEQAQRSAEVTHAHPEAATGAAAVAVAGALMARSRTQQAQAPETLFEVVREAVDARDGVEVKRSLERAQGIGAGTTLLDVVSELGNGSQISCQDSVAFALWLAFTHQDDFEGAVRKAVNAGGDTDTIAAMAGGLVAARLGREGIPGRWLDCVEPLPPLREAGLNAQ